MDFDFSDKRVLVVDDYPDACEDYRLLLRTEIGCEVSTAASVSEALSHLDSGNMPDLVLLDLLLPTKNEGLRVCRAIKGGEIRPDVQVVVFTMTTETPEIIKECLASGADDFLHKLASDEEKCARVRGKLSAQDHYLRLLEATRQRDQRGAVAEFARAVHHDVCNALVAPTALVYFSQRTAGIPVEVVDAAREQLDLIQELTAALRELAEAGGEELLSVVTVNDLLQHVLLLVKHRALQAKVSVHRGETAECVRVNRPNLLFTLAELAVNAIKAHEKDPQRLTEKQGHIRFDTETYCKPEGAWIRLVVTDDGPGVPEELQNSLFEPGVYLRPDGSGSGQGLAIARERVRKLGGRLYHECNSPRGARFVIELPTCPAS